MKNFLASLRTNAWRTAGARYNAANRLRMREWLSACSLALLAALSIGVTFAHRLLAPAPESALDNYLSLLAVGMSVLLLAISLLEWGAGSGAKAATLHRNAELLTAFKFKMEQAIALSESGKNYTEMEISEFRNEYDRIKQLSDPNHLPHDDALFRVRHRHSPEFSNKDGQPRIRKPEAVWIHLTWFLREAWFYILIWIAVVSAIAYAQLI